MHEDLIKFTSDLVKNLVKEPDMVSVQEFLGDDESIMLEISAYGHIHSLNRIKINIDSF